MPSAVVHRLAFAAVAVHLALMLGALGLWVARDAYARGSRHVALWGLAAAFTGGLVGLVYLFVRSDVGERTCPPTRGERAARAVALATLSAWVLASVFSPPDPFTQVYYGFGLLAVTLPLAYVLDYRKRVRPPATTGGVSTERRSRYSASASSSPTTHRSENVAPSDDLA